MGRARNSQRNAYGTLARMPASGLAALHRGWVDAQNSPSRWPRDYDRMPEAEQLLYEYGRLTLLNVIAAGLAVPIWQGGLDNAGGMHVAGLTATAIAGDPWPRKPHA